MTCRDLTEFIIDYRSGELPPDILQRFEQHLRKCVKCRRYLASYDTTVRLARGTFETAPRSGMPEELVQAILAASRAG